MKTWKILLAVLLIVATVGVVLAICLKPAETPTGDNTLTVTFYNGDQVYETVTVEAGAKLTLPKAPKADKGKGFAGWSTIDGDIEEIIDASTFVVNADVKLYAVWADVYTVTINPDNGQPFDVREVFAGTIIERPADPVKEGFKFVEWRDALQESAFDFSQPIYADVILKAMYGDGAPNRVSDTKWDFSTGIHGSWIGAQGGWNYQINELPAKDMVYQTTEDGYAAWGFTLTDSLDNIPVIDGNNEAGLGMKYIYNEGISVSASKAKLVVIYLKPKYFPIDMATSPNDQFRISVLTSNGGMIYGYGSGSEAWSLRTDAGSKNYIQVDHMEDGWIRVQFKIHELEVWSEDAVIKGMAISIVQRKATPVMDIISVKSIELLDQEEFIDPHEIDYVTDNQWDMTQEESSKDWFGVMSAGVDTNSVKTTIDANGTQLVYANTNKWRGLVLNTAKIDISKCSGIFSATIDVSGMQPTNYRIYIVTDQGGDLYKNSGRDDVSCYYAVTSVTELAEGWTITPNADGTITVSYDLTKLEYWKNGTELLGLSFVTVDATTNGTVVYKSISLTGTVEKHDCETQGHVMKDATCTKPQTCTVCGVTKGEAKGHSFKNGACSVCGAPEFVRTEWDMTDAMHAAEWFGYHAKKKNEALTTMVTEDGLVVTYGGAGNGWKGLVLENTAVEISQLTGKLTFTYSSELAITGYRIHILTDLGGNLTANGSAECYIAVDIADVIAGNLADWTQTTNADGSVTVTFDLNSFKYFAKGTELKGLTIVTVTANNVTGSVTYKAIELESNAEKHDCAVSGHIWKDATCTTPKTCLACGATEGKAAGHSWKKATCTAPKTCSVCGLTEGVPAGHNFTDGACTVCGTAEIALSAPIVWDMTDHAYASQWYCAQAYKEIREHITYSEITEEGFKATYLHGNGWKGIILKDVEIDITALSGLLSFTYTEDMDITQYRIHVLTDKGGSLTDNTSGTPSDYYAVVTLDNIAGNSAWTRTENADGSITVTFDLNTLPFYKEGTVLMGMDIVTVTATGTTGTVTYRSVELGAIAEDHNCKNTGHIWKDATCSAPKTCYVCGATKGETVAHTWTDATCTTPKTCTVCGATEGEALGHTLADANCTTPKTCTVCGATVGEALGHTWNNANCTTPKTCTVCGVTEGEVLDHTDIDGDHDHNCDGCGLADVTPHADGDKDLRCDECGAPLCDEGTHTDTDTKDHKCDICGVILSECFDADTDADHNCDHCGKPGITECVPGGAATCTEPQKCTVCGAILNEALGHNWVPATCTKPKTCTICGATDGEVADHRFEDGVCADCGALNYIPVTKNEWDLSNADDAADWDAYHAMKLNEALTTEVTADGLSVNFGGSGNGWKGIVLDKAQIDISKLNGMLTFTYSTDMAVSSYRVYILTDQGGHLLNNSEAGSGYAPANYYVSVKISDIDAGKLTAWTKTANSDGSITVTFDLTTLPFFADGTELKGLTICTVTSNKVTGTVVYKSVELMAAPSDHDCQEDGHLWADATCIHPKTCTVCGATEGEALGHAWNDATCTTPKTCTVCGATEGEALGHHWNDATCAHPKTCTVCGETEGDLGGHVDGNGDFKCDICGNDICTDHIWNDATCTKPKTCAVCGATEGDRLAHTDADKDHLCDVCMGNLMIWYMNKSEDANQWYSAQAYTSVKPEVTTSEVTEDGFVVRYMHKNGWKGIILKNVEIDITKLEGMLSFTYTEEMDITHYRIHVLTDKGGSLTDNTSGTPSDYYAAVALADIAQSTAWTRTENEDGSITVTFDLTTLPAFAEGTVLLGMDIVTVTATGTTGTVTYKSIELSTIPEEHDCETDGHKWENATCTKPKTCSACGATEGERLPHGDGNKDHRCDACECSMVVWYMNNSEDANQWYSAQAYTSVKPEVTTSEVTEDGFEVQYLHKNGWKGIILKNVEIDITGLEGMLSFTYTEEMDITHYRIHVLTDKGGSLTDNTSGTPADYYAAVALADIAASASWTRTENEDGSITVTFDLNTLPFFAEGSVLMGMDIVTVTATGTTGTVTYKSIEIR